MSKKKKLRRQRDQARRDLFLAAAILRSCDDFARMVRDYVGMSQGTIDSAEWSRTYRGMAGGREGTIDQFMEREARRIIEMTEQYTHADRDTESAAREP